MAKLVIGTNKTIAVPAVVKGAAVERYKEYTVIGSGRLMTVKVSPENFFDGVTIVDGGACYAMWAGDVPIGNNGVVDASSVRVLNTTTDYNNVIAQTFGFAFRGNPNITEFICGCESELSERFYAAFASCYNLRKCEFLYSKKIGASSNTKGLYNTFRTCRNIEIKFDCVETITSYGAPSAFNGTSGASVYFPALLYASTTGNALYQSATSATNITFHFPKNRQTLVESFRGYSTTAPFSATSGTVLFDLPSAYILTGADGNEYLRNPAHDTTTALAWYNVTTESPATSQCYTSTTADPVVGDTIYSDSACTVAITTIDTIV